MYYISIRMNYASILDTLHDHTSCATRILTVINAESSCNRTRNLTLLSALSHREHAFCSTTPRRTPPARLFDAGQVEEAMWTIQWISSPTS